MSSADLVRQISKTAFTDAIDLMACLGVLREGSSLVVPQALDSANASLAPRRKPTLCKSASGVRGANCTGRMPTQAQLPSERASALLAVRVEKRLHGPLPSGASLYLR
jgi:hypothetical protein